MAKSRRTYSAEFKREAVQLTHEPVEVAAGLGVDRGLLQRWRSEAKKDGGEAFPGKRRPKASDEELLRVKKELARTQQERDILGVTKVVPLLSMSRALGLGFV